MESWQIVLVIAGLILLALFLKKILRRKVWIFEDVREGPNGREISWWVKGKEFFNLVDAREYARATK